MKKVLSMQLVKTIVALSMILAVFLSTPFTQAQILIAEPYDVKSWGGANCQAYYGRQEGDFDKKLNGIYNNTTGNRLASCGIVQDKLFNTATRGTYSFSVYMVVPGTSRTICYLRESKHDGTSVQTRSNSRNGTGWISVDTSLSVSSGSRTLFCNIPPKGRLSHIRSYELAPTDFNS